MVLLLVERIKFGEKEIVLVGTAHVSEKSTELVKKTIDEEKPDIVGVELDRERYLQLKQGQKWENLNISEMIKSGQTYLFLINVMLANLQRQLGQQLGVKPGMEMITATKIAEEKEIGIALLDRSVKITLKRAMNAMTIIEKVKLLWGIALGLFTDEKEVITKEKVEILKDKDVMNELMGKLSKEMPGVKRILVDERDLFIANKILAAPGKKIVAVLGAGHLEGVKKFLDRPREISHLNVIPTSKNWIKIIGWIIPAIFIVMLSYGLVTKGLETGLWILVWWFLINGTLSALGVLLARGHPFSIIAAFVAAPLTSLNPLIAAGWVAGYVEAKFNSPKVKDFEGLRKLNSYGDFLNNQVTRILIVTAYANIGSTVGTVIALPYILSLVA